MVSGISRLRPNTVLVTVVLTLAGCAGILGLAFITDAIGLDLPAWIFLIAGGSYLIATVAIALLVEMKSG